MDLTVKTASDQSIIVYLDELPTEQSIGRLKTLVSLIEDVLGADLIDTIASYQSVLVIFDALSTDHEQAGQRIKAAWSARRQTTAAAKNFSRTIRLPVYYDLSVGPDLQRIADYHQCSIEKVVERHCMNIYNIFAIGFSPGFAFMGHVDDDVATPRLEQPRKQVAAGSVAVADNQTAIYPQASPGGWNIIGRCPSPLFDPAEARSPPFLVGDRVQFMPISREEYLYLGGSLDDL